MTQLSIRGGGTMNGQTKQIERTRIAGEGHLAPWWLGYGFLVPIRRLWESPRRVCGPWVRPGDTVFELGPAMGWFTLELARLAGPGGRVVCSEVQPRMLDVLARRLRRAGLDGRVDLRLCASRPDGGQGDGRLQRTGRSVQDGDAGLALVDEQASPGSVQGQLAHDLIGGQQAAVLRCQLDRSGLAVHLR